jgi:phospholipid transport system substrate-binding protein
MRKLLLTILLTGLLPSLANAANDTAENRLKASVNEVVSIVKGAKTREGLITDIKPPLEKILNFGVMTRRSIGPSWKQLTPDQQQEAIKLFTVLILRTYTAKFTPGEFPLVEFKPSISTAPGRVEVHTTAMYRGSRYEATYRLEDQGGNWTITDVVIEGVSLVADYRTQFDSEFKRGGVDGLLSAMRRSVASTK